MNWKLRVYVLAVGVLLLTAYSVLAPRTPHFLGAGTILQSDVDFVYLTDSGEVQAYSIGENFWSSLQGLHCTRATFYEDHGYIYILDAEGCGPIGRIQ